MNTCYRSTALAGGLVGLLAAMHPVTALAGVRCNELGLSVCVEARTSGYTYGSIAWDDGALTALQPPDGSFTTTGSAPWEYGTKTSLYAGYGLNSTLLAPYGGLGPALQVDYAVNKGAGSVAPVNGSYVPGQLSNPFIHGQTGVLGPSLTLTGSSVAEIGINRASAGLSGTVLGNFAVDAANVIRPGHTGTAHDHVLASGQSYWMETATFLPASAVGVTTPVDFSVNLDGSLDAWGSGWYSLYATDHLGHVTTILSDTFFGSATPGLYSKTLEGTLTAAAGVLGLRARRRMKT